MNDAEPLLRLRGIGKNFGPVHALTEINLEIPAGQVTALVGDNGAGKSTLIKTIAGIWEPAQGEILWQGRPVHFRSPKEAANYDTSSAVHWMTTGTAPSGRAAVPPSRRARRAEP